MSLSGDVQITVLDGGGSNVVVPSSSVQVVMGCASAGVDLQIVATRSPKTLADVFTGGPMPEAAGLSVNAGGTVLAIKLPTVTAGKVRGSDRAALTVSAATVATPIVITTTAPHGLITGSVVTIAGVGGNTAANGTWPITVLTSTTFSVPAIGAVAYTSGGTVQFTGLVAAMTGTSPVTITGTPSDDLYPQLTVSTGGTIGTPGIVFNLSLDAGRQIGPNISLGSATSYTVPGTGITYHFGAGTLAAGDRIRCSTIAPAWNDAGLAAALQALQSSQYATIGWGGGTHVVGVAAGADASVLQSSSPGLEQLANGYVFTRGIMSSRDADAPAAWGGAGETEATWMAAIESDFSAVSAKRVLAGAGYYNMPSAFPNPVAGLPRYRRPLAWAFAARQITIPPQRMASRVRDGALATIVLDPTNDPNDGFIYHDERVNPGLDITTGGAGRFCSARSRIGLPGLYIVRPLLLAPVGSDFTFWPRGTVMDIACEIVHQLGQQFDEDNVRTLPAAKGGMIDERDARFIESTIGQGLNDQMLSTAMITGQTVTVDRTNNVQEDDEINYGVSIEGVGYILQQNVSIGFAKANAS